MRTPNDVREEIYKLVVEAGREIDFFKAQKIPDSYSLDVIPIEFNRRKLEWIEKT